MKLSKTQIVRLTSLFECNDFESYQIIKTGGEIRLVIDGDHTLISRLGLFVDTKELRDTDHTTTIKARILGCVQSVIVDYDMHKDGSIDIVRMTLEDELFPIEWSRSIEQLVMVELDNHLPKL